MTQFNDCESELQQMHIWPTDELVRYLRSSENTRAGRKMAYGELVNRNVKFRVKRRRGVSQVEFFHILFIDTGITNLIAGLFMALLLTGAVLALISRQ